ncbi:uncharacterized protein LY79DRAFT_654596 [Colletotrichum navitas]|uniref:Uncharacterized protein n=1 Tax=Colletotrichum navitas TaxID=681940 RepID=A0AAD8VCF5_9PEZI|nr:uncharacterized protein LY79DRAFT_654596 [Colletotrichum navitas]KAK1600048.1 hypothetical protein LY79DRAFT_654596 [Colletotrichum navitas]
MSDPEPDRCKQPGVLHGVAAPLNDALRGALYASIETIYAVGGSDTSIHHASEPGTDKGPHAVATNHDAGLEPSFSAPNRHLEAACARLTECLKRWESRIEDRSLHGQAAVYHFHPPSNILDFQNWVTSQSLSAADAALAARLRTLSPKLGFEVFPVVLKYAGTTCQFNGWVQQMNGHVEPVSDEQIGFWKPYQHVKHSPSIFQFNTFIGSTLAENVVCHVGNILDDRNVAWERARRGLFWQSPEEQRQFDEERRVREANPKWYLNIIPGTSSDLGHYLAPAMIIVPFSTQLEVVNVAEQPQPVAHIWRYLLAQCKQSVRSAAYFDAVKALCQFVWPEGDDPPTETRVLGMQIRNRQEWIDAIDSGIMGNLIMASLVFKYSQLCNGLTAQTQIEPSLDYTWVCENASVHGYSAADVLYGLRRFLFKRKNFLQIASIIDKLPAHSAIDHSTENVSELVQCTLDILDHPVSASHGRVVVNLLKLFGDFKMWSDMVQTAIASEPRQLDRHSQFMLGLLNRLLEVTKKDKLPVDEVTAFYQQYAGLMNSSHTLWQIRRLVSNVTKDQHPEAIAARKAWCVAEPTPELLNDKSEPPPTSHSVIAGLFRNLDRLGMHDQATSLADHIVQNVAEIEPIHMSPLWLPLLITLQDLADPKNPAFQRLFQAIFERYHEAVFEDLSGRLEQDPDCIPHMASCCSHCQKLDPYFEQPHWKTLHLVLPRDVVDHIETQLREQEKPIKTVVYGKNEANLTMQLTKTSLFNERLRAAENLRRQEATRTVRQFDPDRLLPFLGDKGEIMWRLGNAESQEAPENNPARSLASTSASAVRLSRPSSSSASDTSLDLLETSSTSLQQPSIKSEASLGTEREIGKATPKLKSHGGLYIIKAEPSSSGSDLRRRPAHKDIQELFRAATVKKEKSTLGSSQGLPKTSSISARDRLKSLSSVKRKSTPKYDETSAEQLRATLDKARSLRVTHGSSSGGSRAALSYPSKPATSPKRTDTAPSSEALRGNEPASSAIGRSSSPRGSQPHPSPSLRGTGTVGFVTRQPGAVAGSSTGPSPRLGSLTSGLSRGLGAGARARSPSESSSSANSSTRPDFMAAILDAERAKKRRPGSTWEVRSALGNVMGSGTSSGKARFDSLVQDKENLGRPSGLSRKPHTSIGAAGRASAVSGALAARSQNVRPGTTRIPASAGIKRKVDSSDDEVIDLCGDSLPLSAKKKKKKGVSTFDFLDDDPFSED